MLSTKPPLIFFNKLGLIVSCYNNIEGNQKKCFASFLRMLKGLYKQLPVILGSAVVVASFCTIL